MLFYIVRKVTSTKVTNFSEAQNLRNLHWMVLALLPLQKFICQQAGIIN